MRRHTLSVATVGVALLAVGMAFNKSRPRATIIESVRQTGLANGESDVEPSLDEIGDYSFGESTLGETLLAMELLKTCVVQHRGFCEMTLDQAAEWAESAIGDCGGQRCTRLELPKGACWSQGTIEILQQEFLRKTNNWSLILPVPDDAIPLEIGVDWCRTYPAGEPIPKLTSVLSSNAAALDAWNARRGNYRERQRAVLQRLLDESLPQLTPDKPFRLLAVFESSALENYRTVCCLMDDDNVTLEGQSGTTDLLSGRVFLVDAQFRVHTHDYFYRNGVRENVIPKYKINGWMHPKSATIGDFTINNIEFLEDDSRRTTHTWNIPAAAVPRFKD